MSPIVTPTPPEILGWMRGFAASYLDHHGTPALAEAARDHAGLALVNFNMHVMARGEAGAERFLGVDRLRIARAVLEASADDLAEWERRIETADPSWKKGLCANLNVVAESMRRGALEASGVPGAGLLPDWAGALLAAGLFSSPDEPPAPPRAPERRVVLPTGVRFLEKSLYDALQKPDLRAALAVLGRIEDQRTPEAAACLRRIASDLLSRDRIQEEPSSECRWAASKAGRKALMALARQSDPEALKVLEGLIEGEKVIFEETFYGPQILPARHPLIHQTLGLVLLEGNYGFDGQAVLEKFLRDQGHDLAEDGERPFSRGTQAAEDLIQAVLKYRSGGSLLRLIAKNPWLDRVLERPLFRDARFYVTVHHLPLLEPLARAGRSETLRRLLRHPDLRRAALQAPPRAKGRAVQSLISIHHQTAGEGDREAVDDLLEETGHEAALVFFRSEISRLRRARSLRGLVLSALGLGPDPREALEARIGRMTARRGFRSA
jgi:hypothetical protein